MRSIASKGICATVLLLLGCTNRDSQPDSHSTNTSPTSTVYPTPAKTAELTGRFEAASEIKADQLRENAFAKLAVDAATAGETDIATKSLAAIRSDSLREDRTYKVAMLLANVGKTEAAVVVAKSLKADTLREQALSKIANGDLRD